MWWSRLSLVSLLVALVSPLASVRADCIAGPPTIVWSYPRDGQTQVPVNADLMLLVTGWALIDEVELAGRKLPRQGAWNHFDLGTLAPHTKYVATWPRPDKQGSQQVTFTTGSATWASHAQAPTITGHATRPDFTHLTAACRAAVGAMDCFDLGQDTHLLFLTPDRPLAWLIETPSGDGTYGIGHLWPGTCGAPELFTSMPGPSGRWSCARLSSIDEAGTLAPSAVQCPGKTAQEAAPRVNAATQALTNAVHEAEHAASKQSTTSAPSDTQASTPKSAQGSCTVLTPRRTEPPCWSLALVLMLVSRRLARARARRRLFTKVATVSLTLLTACAGAQGSAYSTTVAQRTTTPALFAGLFTPGRQWQYRVETRLEYGDEDDPSADENGYVRKVTTAVATCRVQDVVDSSGRATGRIACDGALQNDAVRAAVPDDSPFVEGQWAATSAGLWRVHMEDLHAAPPTLEAKAMVMAAVPMVTRQVTPDGDGIGGTVVAITERDHIFCAKHASWGGDQQADTFCFTADGGLIAGLRQFSGGSYSEVRFCLDERSCSALPKQ